jgi:hypothetical protein
MDFTLAAFGVAFSALCIWLTVRIVNRREKSRRVTWAAALAVAALVGYPLSFGPACRLAQEDLIPESQFMTMYRPCIRLAHEGPQAVSDPLHWWVRQWRGELGLMIAIVRDLMAPPYIMDADALDVAREVSQEH